MSKLSCIFAISILFNTFIANAEIKRLDDILAKATPEESKDLGSLLKQIRMVPATDPETGSSVFKVMAVERGSVYEREGVEVGDLVSGGSLSSPSNNMELKRSRKFENLGTGKVQEIHMTKEEAAAANESAADSFEQGFKNSSPEVQRAILKAAKELDSKKKLEGEKSTEQ